MDNPEDAVWSAYQLLRELYCWWLSKPRDFYFELDEEQYLKLLRISKECTRQLLGDITQHLDSMPRYGPGSEICHMKKICCFLAYVASGASIPFLSSIVLVNENALYIILPALRKAICELHVKYIRRPSTKKQAEKLEAGFFKQSGIPRMLGAVDGCLINIQKPGLKELEGRNFLFLYILT